MQSYRPDVVFISFEEPNAEENFARLLAFAPHAKRVHHVEGEYNAYMAVLREASTPRFFTVDGDSWILDGFKFDAPKANPHPEQNYMWKSRNAVNGLEVMNGSVKFVTRESFASMKPDAVDPTLSIKCYWHVLGIVASETRFNVTPFLAWRCGFREAAKLASGSVGSASRDELIKVWQTRGAGALNGHWCILGARMGAEFGEKFSGTDKMMEINDIRLLARMFEGIAQNQRVSR